MTKSVINTKRTNDFVEYSQIRLNAKAACYRFVRNVECPACKEEMELAIKAITFPGPKPAWANPYCAAMFSKKGKPSTVACSCGYRAVIKIKFTSIEKRICATNGCNVILSKLDPNDVCFKCRKAKGIAPAYETNQPKHAVNTKSQNIPPVKVCNRKNCNNTVPPTRKSVCYECLPPAAKFAM